MTGAAKASPAALKMATLSIGPKNEGSKETSTCPLATGVGVAANTLTWTVPPGGADSFDTISC
ncbi:MAG: hypothetical protein ABSB86_15490 [Bryobacteraceae bacterium]